jgi:hypothetical protein
MRAAPATTHEPTTMNLFTGTTSDEFFGGEVSGPVRNLLHQAAEAPAGERAVPLWTAQALAPGCLAVYYTLYKHHAGRREFELAERAAWRGLHEAARQGGLAADWRAVTAAPHVDFSQDGPQRFWLFTLKALSFIHLRSERADVARELLAKLHELDPLAQTGSEVTLSLLQAADAARPSR